jgi:phosphoglycolate phosphatase-like HAD superfamily hydrolase
VNKEKPVVIVDMDGTLADVRHRLHYIKGPGKKNWKRFFQAQVHDRPFAEIAQQVRDLAANHEIVVVTGRPEEYRPATEEWLSKYRIPFSRIYMRRMGDHRPDYVVKAEILQRIRPERVMKAFEDREPVCNVYREAGIEVVQVSSGEENSDVNEVYRKLA